MTDRVRRLTVVLDQDYRDDDAEHILDAIRMVKGVAGVEAHVQGSAEQMAVEMAKDQLRREIGQVIHDALLPSWLKKKGRSDG